MTDLFTWTPPPKPQPAPVMMAAPPKPTTQAQGESSAAAPEADSGIPAFLRIAQQRRAEAWQGFTPRPQATVRTVRHPCNTPGIVCARHGYPLTQADRDAIERIETIEAARAAAKTAEAEAKRQAFYEQKKAEREAERAMREAGKANLAAFKRATKPRKGA